MLRKSILALLVSLSLIFFVVGCGGNETTDADTDVQEVETEDTATTDEDMTDDSIVGSWEADGIVEDGQTKIIFTFKDDDTFVLSETLSAGQPGEGVDEQETSTATGDGTYKIDGDKLTLTYEKISSDGTTYDGQMIKDDLQGQDVEYTYEIKDDTLTLDNDGTTETLKRVTDVSDMGEAETTVNSEE